MFKCSVNPSRNPSFVFFFIKNIYSRSVYYIYVSYTLRNRMDSKIMFIILTKNTHYKNREFINN